MGYYLGVSYMQPRAAIGAQGGFFSSIGNFLGRAVGRIAPIAAAIAPTSPVGIAGRVISTVAQHPIVSAAAGAATATAVTTAMTSHTGAAATAGVGGIQVHGHLHVGRGRRAAAGLPGMRRHRRMNPCNVRALRRAIRRAHGFERIAKKVLRFTSPHHKAKPHGFKRPRKRATV